MLLKLRKSLPKHKNRIAVLQNDDPVFALIGLICIIMYTKNKIMDIDAGKTGEIETIDFGKYILIDFYAKKAT